MNDAHSSFRRKPESRRKIVVWAPAFAGATLLTLTLVFSGCTSFFYYPDRHLHALPEHYGIRYETVHFPSSDGTDLVGIFLHTPAKTVKGTVVHFHGNAQNLSSHFGFSHWLTAHGYQVFVFDYRGYGGSKGKPSQDGLMRDGIAAIEYLRRRPDVDRDRLAIFAQSLGGAVAVASLASLEDRQGIRAVVLEDTFDSYRSMARDVLRRHWFTWPLQWLPWLAVSERHRPANVVDRLPACPVLVIHGDADRVVPYWLGERLFRRLREPKEFWKAPGADHLEAFTRLAPEFRPRLVAYLDRHVAAHR